MSQHLMVSVDRVLLAEYKYNALGQQVIRRVGGQTIHSIHDADGKRIAEYNFDPVTGTSTLLREYVWMEGQPVAVIEGGQIYYIRTDHIGRPVFATDSTGTKVWEATYLPFGGVHTTTGTPIALRFPGQWFQLESALHQNWMRDYDPTTGRYIQADPLGLVDGASVYGYVRQNPVMNIDPKGEFLFPLIPTIGSLIINTIGIIAVEISMSRRGARSLEAQTRAAQDRANANPDNNTVPWPEADGRRWDCICRAFRDGKSVKNCSTGPLYGFCWGYDRLLDVALDTVKDMALAVISAASTHHIQCKCVGPNGQRRTSGSGIP